MTYINLKKFLFFSFFILLFFVACEKKESTKSNSDNSKRTVNVNTKKELKIYGWANYIPDSIIKKFESKFNCKVIYDMFFSEKDMYEKIKSEGNFYDIYILSEDSVSKLINDGALLMLDLKKIPNFSNIDPDILLKQSYDKKNEYSIPYFVGSVGIIVNKKYVKNYPRDSNIFEMKEYKGKILLLDEMREVMALALKHLGYSANTINPDEIKQAKKLILKWKKNIIAFDSEKYGEKFIKEEAWIVQGYAEDVIKKLDEEIKKNVDFFIPNSGGSVYLDSLVISKNSENVDLSYEFLNFIHEPENYAIICDELGYPSLNLEARKLTKKKPLYTIEEVKKCEFISELGDFLPFYEKIWEEIRIED